jgi:hypothetical protein
VTGLDNFLNHAFKADTLDRLIGPTGNGNYATLLGIVPGVVAVMRAAEEIEQSPDEVMTCCGANTGQGAAQSNRS